MKEKLKKIIEGSFNFMDSESFKKFLRIYRGFLVAGMFISLYAVCTGPDGILTRTGILFRRYGEITGSHESINSERKGYCLPDSSGVVDTTDISPYMRNQNYSACERCHFSN